MTFPIIGGVCAPGILDIPAVAPVINVPTGETDLVRLFALDRLPDERRLACYWRRQPDGRIACIWEPDIVVIPQR